MNSVVNKGKSEDLVSIIIPAYNCEKFIGLTLDSVIFQTYNNWEAIIVDDCSTDNTARVIKEYISKDSRIKYFRLEKNSGAAMSRNKAIDIATGRYIAFLDSDDIWVPEKLEKQINFMESNKYNFTCTGYSKIDEQGNPLKEYRSAKLKSDYNGVLKTCPGNSTVIYDSANLGKFKIPNIKKRNDYVMWLQILKKEKFLYGYNEALGSQRMRDGSISSNKFSLIKYHWKVYREIENLSLLKSTYLVFYWCMVSALKLR
jgi:teichuronic acid biosynthesis glycosyltransferase TuaG